MMCEEGKTKQCRLILQTASELSSSRLVRLNPGTFGKLPSLHVGLRAVISIADVPPSRP